MNSSESNNDSSKPWWPLVLPFGIFMLLTMFEPSFGDQGNPDYFDEPTTESQSAESSGEPNERQEISDEDRQQANTYFLRYSLKMGGVILVLGLFFRYYLRLFPFRLSWQAFVFGIVGAVIWIGLCSLEAERALAALVGLPDNWFASRAAINPANYFAGTQLVLFYAVRFTGLVLIVPFIEELFLRGFFVRYVEDVEWWKVKFHQLGWLALVIAPIYGVLSHPFSEAFAAAAWFGLITWLMVRTRSLWDCIVAHAITNLLLGIYVVSFGQWQLW